MRKQIPNIITLLNLFSGTIAITHAFNGNFLGVVIWVVIAAIFDFFDGMAARVLKSYSPLGKELDSLADVVSFGVAPASTLYILMKDSFIYPEFLQSISHLIPYIAFLIPVFAAYRLAKFNIDTRQSHSFIGLPTPANGLFWISYCYAIDKLAIQNEIIIYITIIAIIIMSIIMISEIPMFSFKSDNKGFKGNQKQILQVLLTIVFLAIFGIGGIALSIIAYIFISLLSAIKQNKALNN
ncbi:MAG TPA: CDP-diacylglycerol--serine O-phosphatidyltransferase [Bacteroidales bacterium]|nr:CDP-diacylglycerol--serine O-phosphatidyltransferase [Bacteroidales bacterium]